MMLEQGPLAISLSDTSGECAVHALISRTGAALDSVQVGAIELIGQWDHSLPRPYSSGLVLAPWPNRVRDGKWTLGQEEQQLDITEPARNNAIHGLVTDQDFEVTDQSDTSVTLSTAVDGEPGYPYSLGVVVHYSISEHGIDCEISITNTGNSAAPVAIGAHPYLTLGDTPVRSLLVSAPVNSHLVVDDHMIPTGEEPVEGTDFDIRTPTPLRDLELDTGFRLRGPGPFETHLDAVDGRRVTLWQSAECGWLQLFVTDEFPGPEGPTCAFAVEPMTAPADALNSGTDLTWLEPQNAFSAQWGIRLQS
jgi:aldose 1-epimerase